MSALARLCALRHFYLNLVGGSEVFGCHAEASRSDLLDGGAAVFLRSLGGKALVALAALAGIGLAVQPVHGDCQRLVRLLRDGSVGHRAGLEAPYNGFHALHLVERERGFSVIEVHQPAQIHRALFLRDHAGVFLEKVIIAHAGRHLQGVNRAGIVEMLLLAAAEAVGAARAYLGVGAQSQRVKRGGVEPVNRFLHVLDGNAAHTADRAGEIFVDKFLAESDGFKYLRAVIGLDGGNAHLGGDLDNAVKNRVIVIVHSGVVILVEQIVMNQLVNGLLREIGIDRARAVA